MKHIFHDWETWLIKAGQFSPPGVCMTYCEDYGEPQILLRDDALPLVQRWIEDDDVTLVGHNIWFDLGVVAGHIAECLPLIFRKIDRGLVQDTMLRQQMIDIAEGRLKYHVDEETGEVKPSTYSLSALAWRCLRMALPKKDTWRLRYAELDGVPLQDWPVEAKEYALKDAAVTANVYKHQEDYIRSSRWAATELDGWTVRRSIPNQLEQHRAAWALHLMSREGVRTDPVAVSLLKNQLTAEFDRQMTELRPSGLLRITPARALKSGPRKGTIIPEEVNKDMEAIYARVSAAYLGRPPMTETGRPATDKKTLNKSGDPQLALLAAAGGTQKLLTTYLPTLESGTTEPIHCRYNPIMETGRASASNPNLMNPPRTGGVRECFIPQTGHLYVFTDYKTLELASLAQACLDILGYSRMAEALRRGEDLHLSLAADMLGIPVAEAQQLAKAGDPTIKTYRQQAKPANFGFPGGMQPESFREYAEGYKIFLTKKEAQALHTAWKRKWPEMEYYFNHVNTLGDPVKQLRSGRIRGGASYTAKCNGFFQGLAADGAKEALWRVASECYMPGTALYGCKPVLFLHDEIGIEAPEAQAADAAHRLSTVMVEAMQKWIPDIPIQAEPVIMRRWYKGAEPVYVDGQLVPSKPEGNKWIADISTPENSTGLRAAS